MGAEQSSSLVRRKIASSASWRRKPALAAGAGWPSAPSARTTDASCARSHSHLRRGRDAGENVGQLASVVGHPADVGDVSGSRRQAPPTVTAVGSERRPGRPLGVAIDTVASPGAPRSTTRPRCGSRTMVVSALCNVFEEHRNLGEQLLLHRRHRRRVVDHEQDVDAARAARGFVGGYAGRVLAEPATPLLLQLAAPPSAKQAATATDECQTLGSFLFSRFIRSSACLVPGSRELLGHLLAGPTRGILRQRPGRAEARYRGNGAADLVTRGHAEGCRCRPGRRRRWCRAARQATGGGLAPCTRPGGPLRLDRIQLAGVLHPARSRT